MPALWLAMALLASDGARFATLSDLDRTAASTGTEGTTTAAAAVACEPGRAPATASVVWRWD